MRCMAITLSLLLGTMIPAGDLTAQSAADVEAAIEGLSWRSIGPAEMGGRTTDIAAIPGDPLTVYFGTATGGAWKTADGGITWESIFESGGTNSVGALALAPSDANVLYLGSGEGNPRNSTSIGDGVYRSTDAGSSWTHVGLGDTERVSRIRIHPQDPDVVYVGAMGHLWGPNEERGVFRSTDGGVSWERVLYIDENTGVADLAMDPSNPRVLYAAMWDFRRRPWTFRSGGPGSGLYRSMDGGDSWERLNDPDVAEGLPRGELGRMGIAVAESKPGVVYAIIESEEDGVLWMSEDRGDSWSVVSSSGQIGGRPFYYHDIRVDPSDENTLYALAGGLSKSIDGGRSWRRIASNMHGDHHALWIDPENPDRLINGNDGGFHASPDGGETWQFWNTVPLAQFYQIAADMRSPYTVCGGLQDNDAWCGPSSTRNVTGPLLNYWHEIIGPGDGTYVQFDPRNPDLIFANTQGGSFFRVDLSTGEARSISPHPVPTGGLPAGVHEYRFNWNAPVYLSPNDPDVVYAGGNVLFRSGNAGQTWEVISPDLSRADPDRLGLSGGLTPDNTTAEYHATIYTISESPLESGVIWVGTDDGNVQLTRDGGGSWSELSSRIPGLPDGAWVSRLEASKHARGTAYASFDRHREDDMSPHVYMTDDYGESWTNLGEGLPTPGYVHVVREDPRVPGMLYVGTETGIWFSHEPAGGERVWASLRNDLPPVPVRDLLIHPRDNDLVIGTHGRGIWIMDDVAPLQELPAALAGGGVHLFTARPAVRFEAAIRRFRFDLADGVFVGENPPYGAVLTYMLPDGADDDANEEDDSGSGLTILDAAGDTVRVLEIDTDPGMHRIAWDLRHERFDDTEDGYRFGAAGPRALPGTYTARLTAGGAAASIDFNIVLDQRHGPDGVAAARARFAALTSGAEVGVEAAAAVREFDGVSDQLEEWKGRLEALDEVPAELVASATELIETADSLRTLLVGPRDDDAERTRIPMLSGLSSVMRDVGRATSPPTDAQADWLDRYTREWGEVRVGYDTWLRDVETFNAELTSGGYAVIVTPDERDRDR